MMSIVITLMMSAHLAFPRVIPIISPPLTDLDHPRSASFPFHSCVSTRSSSHVCLTHAVSGDVTQPDNVVVMPIHSVSPSAKTLTIYDYVIMGVFTDVRKFFVNFAKRSGG